VTADASSVVSEAPLDRKPRKIFLLVGVVIATALGIGLFTSLGTASGSGPPQPGRAVPSFSAPRLNGPGTVNVPGDGGGNGHPAVLLFFGNWCAVCHTEIPSLAEAVRRQRAAGGGLARVQIIGVDSEDTTADGTAFVHASGVTFPVAYDPNVTITSGDFYFTGDPYAVFVNGDGTINQIIAGPLSVARFSAAEGKLIPNGN
jgi:thiol-disulfide isomerase/thioredoxin